MEDAVALDARVPSRTLNKRVSMTSSLSSQFVIERTLVDDARMTEAAAQGFESGLILL
jgi:hypothetical protein